MPLYRYNAISGKILIKNEFDCNWKQNVQKNEQSAKEQQ